MQNAAQAGYEQRKASGFKPVATSDRETLAALQDKIDDKRRSRPDENDLGIIDTYTRRGRRRTASSTTAQQAGGEGEGRRASTRVYRASSCEHARRAK